MSKAPKHVCLHRRHGQNLPLKRQIQDWLRQRRARRVQRVRNTAVKKRVGFQYLRLAAMQKTIEHVWPQMQKKKGKRWAKPQEADPEQVFQTLLTVASTIVVFRHAEKPQPPRLTGNAWEDNVDLSSHYNNNVEIDVDIEHPTLASTEFPEGEFDKLVARSSKASVVMELWTAIEVYPNDEQTMKRMQDSQRELEDAKQEASRQGGSRVCSQVCNQEKLDALERGY